MKTKWKQTINQLMDQKINIQIEVKAFKPLKPLKDKNKN